MSQLFEIKVKLTENQKIRLKIAYNERKTIVIRLSKNSLNVNDILHVLLGTKLRLEEHRKLMNGADVKIFSIEDIVVNEEGQLMLAY